MSTYLIPAFIVSIGLFVWKSYSKSPTSTPPGPKPLPILGNALQMPQDRPWLTFAKWAGQYGDCVYLHILGQHILVVDSFQVANDLLDQRSSIYSDRPHLPMASGLCGFNQAMPLMSYNSTFRRMRQILKKELTTSSLKKYYSIQEHEIRKFISKVLSDPAELLEHTRYYSGSLILKVVYGYSVAPKDDPHITLTKTVMRTFSEATQPGRWAVDIFPWLRYVPTWMPGAGFKRKAAEWYKLHVECCTLPYEWAKSNQDSPYVSNPNVVSTILSQADSWSEEEDHLLLWGASAMYGGGADTSVSLLMSFCLAMALHPEIQAKAHKEIDDVLKGMRHPRVEDLELLPFVQNLAREVLRWNPPTPLGLPHKLTQDDVYKNFKIPKGTLVMPNAWSMLHDPNVYPEPSRFNPDRFTGDPVAIKTLSSTFGFGRRACPGMAFAEISHFISIATVLAVCNISNAVDEMGQKMTSDLVYTSETISHPPRFTCTIRGRSAAAVDLLKGEMQL